METREIIERAHETEHAGRAGGSLERLGSLAVAVLAALLALASVFGRRSITHLLLYQERATDARNVAEGNATRQQVNEGDLLILRVFATDPDTEQAAREEAARLEQQITATFQPNQARLQRRADDLEHKADRELRRYDAFEVAETALQLAIVFTTITMVARSMRLFWVSAILGLIGLIFLLDGFLVFLPW